MTTATLESARKGSVPEAKPLIANLTQMDDAEIEQLLRQLASELMTRRKFFSVRIEEDNGHLVVSRFVNPTPVEKWSDVYPPEYAAELERRCATLGEGRVLLEFTDDFDETDEAESKQS